MILLDKSATSAEYLGRVLVLRISKIGFLAWV